LLRHDLGSSGLTATWRTFKQNAFGFVSLILHACFLCNLIIDMTMSQRKKDSVLNVSLNVFIACKLVPNQFMLSFIRNKHSTAESSQRRSRVTLFLSLLIPRMTCDKSRISLVLLLQRLGASHNPFTLRWLLWSILLYLLIARSESLFVSTKENIGIKVIEIDPFLEEEAESVIAAIT
jgi:hypothetical protein